ncbi:hypothetical protein MHH56_09545 [Paenibacillus sp. FSL K6-3182]
MLALVLEENQWKVDFTLRVDKQILHENGLTPKMDPFQLQK